MFSAIDSPYLVPFDGSFTSKNAITSIDENKLDDKAFKKKLGKLTDKIHDLQRIMYAHDSHSLLLVFQAMDAAGKDSTIRHVLTGVNPAGCQVFSFKKPSDNELDHDYLWRTTTRMPERGRIGVFNRSYYEEVLVVRVHPEILNFQKLPEKPNLNTIWDERFESIRHFEEHMARNGTVIVKFWLNVSKEEQRNRFLSRLNEPEKYWKFSEGDVKERGHWDDYMQAYDHALRETSRSWAPWYAIPADNKPYMRYAVAKIIAQTLESFDMHYPTVDGEAKKRFDHMREVLINE